MLPDFISLQKSKLEGIFKAHLFPAPSLSRTSAGSTSPAMCLSSLPLGWRLHSSFSIKSSQGFMGFYSSKVFFPFSQVCMCIYAAQKTRECIRKHVTKNVGSSHTVFCKKSLEKIDKKCRKQEQIQQLLEAVKSSIFHVYPLYLDL